MRRAPRAPPRRRPIAGGELPRLDEGLVGRNLAHDRDAGARHQGERQEREQRGHGEPPCERVRALPQATMLRRAVVAPDDETSVLRPEVLRCIRVLAGERRGD